MRVNVSQLTLWMECPRKWWFRYHHKRGVQGNSQALEDGLAWHDLMESAPSSDLALRDSDPLWMKAGYDAWLSWKAENPEITHIAKELVLEAPLSYHTLFGRLDALVRWNGKLWHLQHKTVAPTKPIPCFQRYVARSWHEHAYQYLIEHNYPNEEFAGCILVSCRKLVDKTIVEYLKNGLSNLVVAFLPLPDHARIIDNIASTATSLDLALSTDLEPEGNSSMCAGYYRNSLCPYIDVCDGVARIEDMGRINPLEGYNLRDEYARQVRIGSKEIKRQLDTVLFKGLKEET